MIYIVICFYSYTTPNLTKTNAGFGPYVYRTYTALHDPLSASDNMTLNLVRSLFTLQDFAIGFLLVESLAVVLNSHFMTDGRRAHYKTFRKRITCGHNVRKVKDKRTGKISVK